MVHHLMVRYILLHHLMFRMELGHRTWYSATGLGRHGGEGGLARGLQGLRGAELAAAVLQALAGPHLGRRPRHVCVTWESIDVTSFHGALYIMAHHLMVR